METEKLHIPVPFRAVPSPRVTWHKDGKELKADERLGFRSAPQFTRSELDPNLVLLNWTPAGNQQHVRYLTGSFVFNRKEYTSCHLEIDSSLHADAGQYKVTLENRLGAASGTINVKVIGTQSLTLLVVVSLLVFTHFAAFCLQVFLVPVRKSMSLRSQRAPAKCPGILQTTTAAARSSTTSCRSAMETSGPRRLLGLERRLILFVSSCAAP